VNRRLSLAAALIVVLAVLTAAPPVAFAQEPLPAPGRPDAADLRTLPSESVSLSRAGACDAETGRACPGCPARHPWYAVGEVLGINPPLQRRQPPHQA